MLHPYIYQVQYQNLWIFFSTNMIFLMVDYKYDLILFDDYDFTM